MRWSPAAWLLGAALLALGCRSPTEVTVDISTDVDCPDLRGTLVSVGTPARVEREPPVASTDACTDAVPLNRIGSLVIVPGDANDAEFGVKVVAGVDSSPESCSEDNGYQGCIVARRAMRFVPHEALYLPIPLRGSCKDVPCTPTTTCVLGQCTSSTVENPALCVDPSVCGESGGTSGSGGGGGGGGGPGTTWSARHRLSLDLGGDGTVPDFPLLVVLTGARIDYGQTQDGGQDLRFTAADGTTLLPHEIEVWNEGGAAFVWVRVPSIVQSGSNKTSLWMYYGNPGASDGQQVAAVWAPAFRGVWHLHQAGDALGDSSGVNPDAENHGSTQVAGKIGGARAFDRTQLQYIDTLDVEYLPKFTVEAWAFATALPTTSLGPNGIVMRERNYQMVWDHTNGTFDGGISFRSGGTWQGADYFGLVAGAWRYLAATYDGTTLRAYLEGTLSDEIAMGPPDQESNTAKIGKHAFQTGSTNHFNGRIDEVRISNVARSAAWIRAQHRAMTDSGLITFGGEEQGAWVLP